MAGSLQVFLAEATRKSAENLEAAVMRLPEDKRNWIPMGEARSAMNMVAECATLGDPTEIVRTRSFPSDFDFADYQRRRDELAKDWNACWSLLHANVERAVTTIREVPDEDLGITVQMPWGSITIGQIISYPYWNMSYHEGQINYIASMLGCLD